MVTNDPIKHKTFVKYPDFQSPGWQTHFVRFMWLECPAKTSIMNRYTILSAVNACNIAVYGTILSQTLRRSPLLTMKDELCSLCEWFVIHCTCDRVMELLVIAVYQSCYSGKLLYLFIWPKAKKY